MIVTTKENPKPDHWYAIVDYDAEMTETRTLSSKFQRAVKLGVYYLRSFDIYDSDINIERIGKEFDGIGINIYVSQGPGDKGQTRITFRPTGTMTTSNPADSESNFCNRDS